MFLRWKHARTSLQAVLLLVATLVILDGFFGPSLAAKNLAGVLPWVHWRGFVALALLVAGNLFCMACPFMLPRRLAKRFLPATGHWPKAIPQYKLGYGKLLEQMDEIETDFPGLKLAGNYRTGISLSYCIESALVGG